MTQDTPTGEPSDEPFISPQEQREVVRKRYAEAAARADGDAEEPTEAHSRCCDGAGSASEARETATQPRSSCCESDSTGASHGQKLGYSSDELDSVAAGANLDLGCGNPNAIASLEPGETVLDLGSGGGFDCFLAAQEVGPDGFVIGVDMTPEMVGRARSNVAKNDVENVEFRLGEIENLPVPDEHVDVVISNCVINLSPAKGRVFEEAFRVLRPGGRLAITDVVLTAALPADVRADPESLAACVGGASTFETLESLLERAGFESVSIEPKAESDTFIREWSSEYALEEFLVSAEITGTKPPEAG